MFYMKMNKLILLLPLSLPILSGCNTSNSGDTTVVDMLGRTISYNKNEVNKVVCIGAGALRYYSYICDVNKLVGVEDIDGKNTFGVGQAVRPYYTANYDVFKELPSIGLGGPKGELDPTKILLSNPDIVISFLNNVEANDNLQEKLGGIPVVALKQGSDGIFDEVTLKSFKLLADIFNREARYLELKNYIDACKTELNNLSKVEETYYEGCIGNWGSASFTGTYYKFPVLEYAKVTNPVDSLGIFNKPGQVEIGLDKLTEINPDNILIDSTGLANFKEELAANPDKYSALSALHNGHTYNLLPYNAYYTNLEIQIISTYYVASIAHPSSFIDFDIEIKADEILNKFVGKSIYQQLKANPHSGGGYGKINFEN